MAVVTGEPAMTEPRSRLPGPHPSTYSIVGVDPEAEECGIAVQSKFLAVGAVVPWARAGVGAVATQAFANLTYGNRGLALLEAGKSPQEAIDELTGSDEMASHRQVGIVAADGRSASYTGEECFEFARSRTGAAYAAQGNILAAADVVDAIAEAFEATRGPLTVRLLEALNAGEEAGGDKRGRESSALVVVRPGGGYGGDNDRWLDLRVDHSDDPIGDLRRLVDLHDLYFGKSSAADLLPFDEALRGDVGRMLEGVGYWDESEGLEGSLMSWMGWNNLEERWHGMEGLDPLVLRELRIAAEASPSRGGGLSPAG
jgi:uncharacterized Ntn-hydrolase superfamily protein